MPKVDPKLDQYRDIALRYSSIVHSVEQQINSEVKNEIYNIAGGFEQTNYDTVKKIIKEYFKRIKDMKNNNNK